MQSRALGVFITASVCLLAQTPQYNPAPTRAFGQAQLAVESGNPNLVEGREFYLPQSIAFDNSVSPPTVYVADVVNNRVLAWKNSAAIAKGNTADLVIGQNDLSSTIAGGPGRAQTIGLTAPAALAVDSKGNLYVADAGNNRILRFPQPFAQTSMPITPDLVIGQHSFNSGNAANEGAGIPSAKTLAMSSGSVYTTGMTFDKQGNLWVTDPLNNRVVRFPASALSAGTMEPSADFVLGQVTFDTNTVLANRTRLTKTTVIQPSGVAFSEAGDLYISDFDNRVLYFKGPVNSNGQAATRVLGMPTPTTSDPNPAALNGCPTAPPQPCESALGVLNGNKPPQGVAVLNNSVYVADSGNNRIVKYDTPDKWGTECVFTGTACASGTLISPPGILFIGQPSGQTTKANQGGVPNASTLAQPVSLAFQGTDLWVVDAANNRVLDLPQGGGGSYGGAIKVLGQIDYTYNAPNLIEGRELFIYDPATRQAAAGIAVDTTSDPPHLYIADTYNNRILGFKDARKVKPGDTADIIIGQLNQWTSSPNYFTHDTTSPTDSTLYRPVGLRCVNGDLWVADSGNGRVIRFPQPFGQTSPYRANLVLGQSGFFINIPDPTQSTMRSPWGLAFTSAGNLLVSDASLNRVLVFKKPAGGDFTNGQAASAVIGQANFTSYASGTTANRFNSPHGIATDSSDRLYVTDTGNNRVSIFSGSDVNSATPDPSARFSPGVGQPLDIAVNSYGQVWVTDLNSSRMTRFPVYEDWFATQQYTSVLASTVSNDAYFPVFPVAIALDGDDNPIVAESINRVSMYFMQGTFQNWASYATTGLTPGMLAYLYRYGPPFAPGVSATAKVPLPTTLGDLQVLMSTSNGTTVCPIYQVSDSRVDFQVPWSAPTDGNANVQLIRASTGQVLAAATFPMHLADPGLFTSNQTGSGQLAVINQDGTVNSPTNAAARGSIIALFGTGIGPVSPTPPDGDVPSGQAVAPGTPTVSMANPGPGRIDSSNITYFGLVNWFPGVFQLNVKIPDTVPPSSTVNLGVVWLDFFSTTGPTVNGQQTRVTTTIAVK